jgi:hypothetical protein
MLENMTTTELIAFWGTFVLTICGFISWFTIDEKSEKPPEATRFKSNRARRNPQEKGEGTAEAPALR